MLAEQLKRGVNATSDKFYLSLMKKDWDMVMLLDDRARQVERDTGRVFCRHPRGDLKAYGYPISRNLRQMNRRR